MNPTIVKNREHQGLKSFTGKCPLNTGPLYRVHEVSLVLFFHNNQKCKRQNQLYLYLGF